MSWPAENAVFGFLLARWNNGGHAVSALSLDFLPPARIRGLGLSALGATAWIFVIGSSLNYGYFKVLSLSAGEILVDSAFRSVQVETSEAELVPLICQLEFPNTDFSIPSNQPWGKPDVEITHRRSLALSGSEHLLRCAGILRVSFEGPSEQGAEVTQLCETLAEKLSHKSNPYLSFYAASLPGTVELTDSGNARREVACTFKFTDRESLWRSK